MVESDLSGNSVEHNGEAKIVTYLRAVIKHEGSDLHLKANTKARIRIAGTIRQFSGDVLSNGENEAMVFEIMTHRLKEQYAKEGAADFAYDLAGEDRFRINVFRQRGMTSLAARRVTRDIPTFDQLHLPAILPKLADNLRHEAESHSCINAPPLPPGPGRRNPAD